MAGNEKSSRASSKRDKLRRRLSKRGHKRPPFIDEVIMATTKFLYLYRSPAGAPSAPPSPEQMQEMFAQWNSWKEKFSKEIIDLGDGLKPSGAVYKAGAVTDGPFIEAKEVMAGFSIVQTESLARAIEIAKSCPMNHLPGASIEIREMAGF